MSNDTIGADAELNLNRWTSNVESMAGDVTHLEGLLGGMAEASADTTSAFEEMYEALSDDIEINLDTAALDELEDIDTEIAIDIAIAPTDESKGTIDWLDVFAKVQLLKMGLEFIGAGVDLVKQLAEWAGFGIALELDFAGARFEGIAGAQLPEGFDAQQIALDIYVGQFGDYGKDLSEVYKIMTEIVRRSRDITTEAQLFAATLASFQVADIMGISVEQAVNTLDRIQKSGFAATMEEAADLLVAGFLDARVPANEWIMLVDRALPTMREFGFTGKEMFNVLSSATQIPTGEITELIGLLDKVKDNLRSRDWQAQDDFLQIGYFDETMAFLEGEISGGQWLDGFVTALGASDNEDLKQKIVDSVFGGGISVDDIMLLDASTYLQEVDGITSSTAATINDTWASSWSGLLRTIKVETFKFFDGLFDFQGIIDMAKRAVGVFFSELESGQGVFAALEVALGVPGLEGILQGFQTAMADAAIGIMNAVAWLMGVIPGTGGASDFLREGAAGLSRLQADIEFGRIVNEDDVVDAVRRSATRGLEGEEIAQRLVNSFENASPDIQRAIIDASRLAFQQVDIGFIVGRGMVSEWREASDISHFLGEQGQAIVTAAAFEEALAGVVRQSEIAGSVIGLTGDSMIDWRNNASNAAVGMDTLAASADDAIVPMGNIFGQWEEWRDTAIETDEVESANESVMRSMGAMGAGGARVLNKLSATTRSTRGKVREDVVDMAVASESAGGRMEIMLRETADVWGSVAFNIEQDIMRIVDALNLLPTADSVAGIMGAIGAGANHIVNATNNNTVNVTNNGAAAAAQTNNFINQVRGFD